MKLCEPGRIAEATESDTAMGLYDAQINRSEEFWKELERDFDFMEETEDTRSDHEIMEDHRRIEKSILDYLGKLADALGNGRPFNLPTKWHDEDTWNDIKFILAFNTAFDYLLENEEDGELSECLETDYLDHETSFRHDVVKACDRLALNGAALAKRIGSDTYALWADAMIKLGDQYEQVQCKAADVLVEALVRMWADLRTWIFMNPPHNAKKSKQKAVKGKK